MFSRKKILVVEDNALNRALLCEMLSAEYDVLEAENGQAALDVLGQYGEGISLILLDIIMPVMDGYTFLSIVKADADYSMIPVIVTTQNDREADEVAALAHGATDFVAKPYKPKIILHRVASIINLRETAAMINLMQYDRLTGLYSKAFFYQKVKEVLLRNPDRQYDIICSDIENFKLINDVFGVPTGDRLLRGVAQMYEEQLAGRGTCGRINADQFACLIERRSSYTEDMFLNAIAQVNSQLEIRNLVMKWGIYTIEDRTLSVEQMCDRALLAARSIKGQYGKYFAAYDDTLRNRLLKEQAITDSMETALAENQFQIYLQPKYRIRDERMIGAEALVRWIHPTWGFQSPAEFIPLFEKNGFITKLDQFVWDRTCAILRAWDDRGLAPISVSVNVSRADIYNADLTNILMGLIRKYELSPARLHLEITESAYTENPRQIIDAVSRLRELGFIIEMDDFGSGYSSLNMLNEMPIDILKLDMKFIQSETAKPNSQGILQFIINLARWMHLSVVAEGVETKEQLRRLSEISCDYVQGYYFAKPMPQADFEALLTVQGAAGTEACAVPTYESTLPALLVVDEDPDYQSQVRAAAQGRYQVAGVDNSADALAYIEAHSDLAGVVLSLTLPGEDSFPVLRAIQRKKDLWRLPVIATAPPNAALEYQALDAGADDFICKPHLMKSLLHRMQRAISQTANREQARIWHEAAYQDPLTGLLNQKGLDAAMQTLGKSDLPVAVYLFELVSPASENAAQAQQLRQFGTVLRTQTREKDILARTDGADVIALIKQMPSAEIIEKKGNEICAAAHANRFKDGAPIACRAGAAIMEPNTPIRTVIQRAKQALARAQAQESGCCLWKEETV